MPEDYVPSDAETPGDAVSYGGGGQDGPPLWTHGGVAFQPTGDSLADNTHRAVRALVGLDNPNGLQSQTRATMEALRPPEPLPLRPGPLGGFNANTLSDTGGQIYKILNPRTIQTGSWSEPYFPADEGQQGNAIQGMAAIRNHWSSNKGGVYAVDPKTMGMESGIDIGQQMQDSIDHSGFMRGVLDRALKSGQPVPFDSGEWGLRRFNHGSLTPDGSTVGRWGGFVQGVLSATPDGQWSVKAGVWPQKTGQYDLNHPDAGGSGFAKDLGNDGIVIDRKVSGNGTAFWMNFNRIYNFQAIGHHTALGHSNE